MITCRMYRDGVLKEEGFDPARVSDLLAESGSLVWLDVTDPTEAELEMIQEEFAVHPLSLEDVRHRGQRPKVEVYEGYFFIVLHGIAMDPQEELVDSEIHAFAGPRFLVTLRWAPLYELSSVMRRWDAQPELTREGGAFLLYILLDEVVDDYFAVIDRLEDLSEDLEDRVFGDDPDPTVQETIFRQKRRTVAFRRLVLPLREVLDLVQEQVGFVTPTMLPYYRDVADHVIRAVEFTDNLREILTAALEAQLTQVSLRLNFVMKKLTSWAAIILLPTLIAGIYGMNFQHMPELGWLFGYPFALGLMAASSSILYVMFRRRDWL